MVHHRLYTIFFPGFPIPPILFTENTRLLMGNNMFQIPAIPFERQIDPWFDDAQDKR